MSVNSYKSLNIRYGVLLKFFTIQNVCFDIGEGSSSLSVSLDLIKSWQVFSIDTSEFFGKR